MKKRFFYVVIPILMVLLFVLSACVETNGFYTLQEAYDRGYLTKEDLEQIAYYINNGLSCPEPLDSSIEDAIKESAAYEMRNRETHPYPEATADDFTILNYYGSYSDCFVVSMNDCYDLFPADVPNYWEEIGGVQFHITNYNKIRVWIAK